jgi:hypothetical protein
MNHAQAENLGPNQGVGTHIRLDMPCTTNWHLSIPTYLVYTLSALVAMNLLITLNEPRWVGVSVGPLKVGGCALCSREQCRS